MDQNAFVVWRETERPWEDELAILRSGLPLPLNIRDNASVAHTSVVTEARKAAMQIANELPVVADSGGGRREVSPSTVQRPRW